MRKIALALCITGALLLGVSACKTTPKENNGQQQATKKYKCPMEKHTKVYDKPGKCAECGMALKEVK